MIMNMFMSIVLILMLLMIVMCTLSRDSSLEDCDHSQGRDLVLQSC